MGVPGTQRRMGGGGGERRGGGSAKFMMMTPWIISGLAAFIVVMNLRILGKENGLTRGVAGVGGDDIILRMSMERKIQALQYKVVENGELLTKILKGLESAFQISQRLSVDEMRTAAQTEAAEIMKRREAERPPPFSPFARSELEASLADGSLNSLVGSAMLQSDSFGYGHGESQSGKLADQGWEWGPQADDDFLAAADVKGEPVTNFPSEDARFRQCYEWFVHYKVVPGIDWGSLPEQEQGEWKAFLCDRFDFAAGPPPLEELDQGSTSLSSHQAELV